jgi:hypothetical protein
MPKVSALTNFWPKAIACDSSAGIASIATTTATVFAQKKIVEAYTCYCQSRAWKALGVKQCQWQLPDVIMELFGVTLGDKILREGKRGRGYPHLSLKGLSDEGGQRGVESLGL